MTVRHAIAAAALSTIALLSGTSLAADFGSQLSEAQVAAPVAAAPRAVEGFDQQLTEAKVNTAGATRETREIVVIHLSAAEGYAEGGNQVKAQQYLNFARGKLGLPVTQARAAQPVVASGAAAQVAQDIGIVGLPPEAH